MINIQRFRHVAIVVEDLDRMVEFYTGVLGLKLKRNFDIESEEFRKGIGIKDAKARGAHLMVPDSNVEIELFQFIDNQCEKGKTSVANMIGYRHMAFIVDDLEKAVEILKENGVEFFSEPITVNEPESVRGFRFVYFRDPEGNIIELNKLPEKA